MLRSTKELKGYTLRATDGDIGECKDFLFDDLDWGVRYMVADTGRWIPEKKILISPISLGDPDWASNRFPVHLTKEEVKKAPPLAEDEPVSRQHEMTLSQYYGYPYYWVGNSLWGPEATPAELKKRIEKEKARSEAVEKGDPHLRSVEAVTGYHISAADGEVGHVEEFIVDDQAWALRYMVVDTRNWLPGRKVLISPDWVEDFDWEEEEASVAMEQGQIRNSPEYDPRAPINRGQEARLYDFYGRPVYW
ncbi:MAG: PRC-barrel domain containing protein [Gemmatimonadota bacterium]|jgi:hypothetical protein